MKKYYLKWRCIGEQIEQNMFGKVQTIDEHVTTVEVERDNSEKFAPKDVDIRFTSTMVATEVYTVHIDYQVLALSGDSSGVWLCEFPANGSMIQINVMFDDKDEIEYVKVQIWFNSDNYYYEKDADEEITDVELLSECEL